jgi:hypothetical protein
MAGKQTKVTVAEKQIHEMTTKEFRAYVKTLTPEQAEWVRRARRAFTKARWAAADPEHVAKQTTRRWRVWISNLSEEQHEELRARDRERKRRERAKS